MENSQLISIFLMVNVVMLSLALLGRLSLAIVGLVQRIGATSPLVGRLDRATGEYVYDTVSSALNSRKGSISALNICVGVTGAGTAFFGVVHIATVVIKGTGF